MKSVIGKSRAIVICGSLPVILAACATEPFGDDTRQRMDAVLDDSLRATEQRQPPPEVAEALTPRESRRSAYEREQAESRFDVSVRNVPARTFFMGLVEDTEYNMIVDEAVDGRISLNLRNVTIPEVMEAVREVYGYEYRELAGGYLVRPAGMQTRVFSIDYLHLTREGSSSTRVSSGSVSDGQIGQRSRAGGRGFGGAGGGDRGGESRTVGTRIETESKSDFWADMKATLEAIVADTQGGRVILNPQSGTVAIRAMPQELREIEEYLATMQTNVGRQVVLEAKILEVELRDEFRSGINWGGLYTDGGDGAYIGQVGGRELFSEGRSSLEGSSRSLIPGAPLEGMTTDAFGGTFAAALNVGSDFRAFIELLSRQGETRVLSSPRVSTVNNQKAVIKVGTDEFFVTGIQSGGAFGAAGATQQRNVELTPFFSGIALDVTPQISANNDVTLHIHPTVSQVTDQRKDLTIGGETDSLPLAFSEVRESDSIVRASSGQVVVIGGLMQNQMRDEVFSTPLLGNIPVLGHLFRHTRQRESKTELVILLRPIVVESNSQWDDMTREYQDDIRDMRRPGRR